MKLWPTRVPFTFKRTWQIDWTVNKWPLVFSRWLIGWIQLTFAQYDFLRVRKLLTVWLLPGHKLWGVISSYSLRTHKMQDVSLIRLGVSMFILKDTSKRFFLPRCPNFSTLLTFHPITRFQLENSTLDLFIEIESELSALQDLEDKWKVRVFGRQNI